MSVDPQRKWSSLEQLWLWLSKKKTVFFVPCFFFLLSTVLVLIMVTHQLHYLISVREKYVYCQWETPVSSVWCLMGSSIHPTLLPKLLWVPTDFLLFLEGFVSLFQATLFLNTLLPFLLEENFNQKSLKVQEFYLQKSNAALKSGSRLVAACIWNYDVRL